MWTSHTQTRPTPQAHLKFVDALQQHVSHRRDLCGHVDFDPSSVSSPFQVLQHSVDRELWLYADLKEQVNCVAHVMMVSLTSQPVDHLENGRHKLPNAEAGKRC